MKMDFSLQMQQEQKLVMTQELQMAVKILQLTSFELKEFLEDQVVENPILEIKEWDVSKDNNEVDVEKIADYLYYDPEERYYDGDDEYVSPINYVKKELNLYEYLKDQLSLIPLSEIQRRIGEYIIDNIDENGYLTVSDLDILKAFKVEKIVVDELIDLIQDFEPSGVCARSIGECLKIQLKNKGINDSILFKIVDNNLRDIALGDIDKIKNYYELSRERIMEYIEIIKSLDPKPGIRIGGDITRYIAPDVYIERVEGKYVVTVNENVSPKIFINKSYKNLLRDKGTPEYKYLKERLESALWLLKSIEQRKDTIKNVVEAVLKHQIDYFERDMELKPMSLKDIAKITKCHESTVSRAVKGKYVQTPKGLFEIKNFFVRGMQFNGEEVSVDRIKDKIRKIIDGENKKKPLSDQQISEILKESDIDISRRTVAKYREELGIMSSSKRKSMH